jgi:hypothetical protein
LIRRMSVESALGCAAHSANCSSSGFGRAVGVAKYMVKRRVCRGTSSGSADRAVTNIEAAGDIRPGALRQRRTRAHSFRNINAMASVM